MINLSNIDILTVNSANPRAGLAAIKHCQKFFNFGRAIILSHEDINDSAVELIKVPKIESIDGYNDAILNLNRYSSNSFVLVVQDDGFITNPALWADEFLDYDYIGAPWPSEKDSAWIELQNPRMRQFMYNNLAKNRVGNGGFSLRSKKYLQYSAQFASCDGFGEDAFLNILNYDKAIEFGIKFAPFELAKKFSYENPFYEDGETRNANGDWFQPANHFGFHGHNFYNSQQLINSKF